jgi:hypothetical protein
MAPSEIIEANQPKNQHDTKEPSQKSDEVSNDRRTDAKVGKVAGVSRKVHFPAGGKMLNVQHLLMRWARGSQQGLYKPS